MCCVSYVKDLWFLEYIWKIPSHFTLYCLLFKQLIDLNGIVRRTDRRSNLPSVVHFSNGCTGWGCARLKPRTQSCFWVWYMVTGGQLLGRVLLLFQLLAGSWIGSRVAVLGFEPEIIWVAGITGGGLTSYAIAPAPSHFIFILIDEQCGAQSFRD